MSTPVGTTSNKCRDRMSGSHVAGVFQIVVEVFIPQHTVLIADQPVGIDLGGIELDLNLHVLGDRDERSAHLFDEHFARFVQRVDVGVVAVAAVGEFFERRVFQISEAETRAR